MPGLIQHNYHEIERARRNATLHFVRALYRWNTAADYDRWTAMAHLRFATLHMEDFLALAR